MAGCYYGLCCPNALWLGAALLIDQLIKKMPDSQVLLTKMNYFMSPPCCLYLKLSLSPSNILRREFMMGATDVRMQYVLNNELPGQTLHHWGWQD